jgi:F-type H+-transporting ATPase subunit a
VEGHFTWYGYLLSKAPAAAEQVEKMGISHASFDALAGAVLATFLIVVLSLLGKSALGKGESAIKPSGRFSVKGFFEAFVEFINGIIDMVIGHGGRSMLPLFGAVFFYIALNNMLGLVPGFPAATSNMNVTLALGLFSFVVYNTVGLKHGGVHYLAHFMGPIWWMAWLLLPIELISHCVRPLSLGIRLSVNMTADHTILGTFIDLTKVGIPVIFYGMGTFVSLLQAFVFTMLSMVYVMMATADDH